MMTLCRDWCESTTATRGSRRRRVVADEEAEGAVEAVDEDVVGVAVAKEEDSMRVPQSRITRKRH